MKKSPISEHKEKDAKLMRLTLLEIIEGDAGHKDKTEAIKALARMHSLLQADRTIEKPKEKDDKLKAQDKKELNERVNRLLGELGHSKGQGTTTGTVS